jgi:hypothetical protein
MAWYPDLGSESPIASGAHVRAIGWLSVEHAHTRGDLSPLALSKLKRFCTTWRDSTRVLRWPIAKGRRACDFCRSRGPRGAFGIPGEEVLYVVPESIWHCCHAHDYLPPREFTDAVLRCPEFITKAYASRVRDFIGAPVVEHFRPLARLRSPERRR